MEKIKNLSLRKTIILYMVIALSMSFLISIGLIVWAGDTQEMIWYKYIDQEKYNEGINLRKKYSMEVVIPRVRNADMSREDARLSELCDFIETWTILLLTLFSSVCAVMLFYRNKIKVPLSILTNASNLIAEDNLEFTVDYDKKDEMGELCNGFEKMRKCLQANNKKMWSMYENERNLRAAIAHDIRSPLTVLKGYQEMLAEFIPDETFDKQKILEILQIEMGQTERMYHFIEEVRKLSKLEEREPIYKVEKGRDLVNKITITMEMLCKERQISWKITEITKIGDMSLDISILMESVENILSNAVRYAKESILLELEQAQGYINISIFDDGTGFHTSQDEVTKLYFHENSEDNLKHFGLGLYLVKLYCEKHGGKLVLGNISTGGAYAKISFRIK